jgi:hypothetical protein
MSMTHLETGCAIAITIDVSRRQAETGVCFIIGESYSIVAEGIWWDFYLPSDPAGHVHRLALIDQMIKPLLRDPELPWCSLIGADLAPYERQEFAIAQCTNVTSRIDGEFRCYVNDVPGFFRNDFGSLLVTLRRLS